MEDNQERVKDDIPKLVEDNFLEWKQRVMMDLRVKKMLMYLNQKCKCIFPL